MNKSYTHSIYPPKILIALLAAILTIHIILLNANDSYPFEDSTITLIISTFLLFSGGLIIAFRPIWGIASILFLLPLQEVWPEFGSTIFSGIPIITSFIVIVGLLTFMSTIVHLAEKKINAPKLTFAHLLAILFVFWTLFSHYDVSTPFQSGNRLWFWTYMQLFILMILTSTLISNLANLKIILCSLIIGTVISVIGGVINGGFIFTEQATFGVRLAGLHGSPNEFAMFCVISLIGVNFLLPSIKNNVARIFIYFSVPIMFFGLAFSISRSGLVSAIIVALILLASKFRVSLGNLFIRSTPIIFVVIFILVVIIIPNDYRTLWFGSIYDEVQNQTGTTALRFELWDIAITGFKENPITGMGPGNYTQYAEHNWTASRTHRIMDVHNTYLGLLSETGIIGAFLMIGYCMIVVSKLRSFKNHPDIDQTTQNMTQMLTLIFIALATYGMFSSIEYSKVLWFSCGAAIGLTSNLNFKPNAN